MFGLCEICKEANHLQNAGTGWYCDNCYHDASVMEKEERDETDDDNWFEDPEMGAHS